MKKPSLSVAIPAFNEGKNIEVILTSLIKQKRKSFTLKSILVHSDASTDNTCEQVKKLSKKYPEITLKAGKKRQGKYFRMNQIFHDCRTDFLVVLDADIKLVGRHFLDTLVHSLQSDPKALMVAAHQVLLQPSTFIGKVIHANFVLWDLIRWSIPNYDSANNFYGSATAFRGSFARTVHIPSYLSDPHLFIYLSADKYRGFRYCRQAEILQWPISTLKDYRKLLNRSLGKRDILLEKIFNVDTEQVYHVPLKYKVKGVIQALRWQPMYIVLAMMLNFYMQKLRHFTRIDKNAVWDIVTSTKKTMV